MTGSDTLPAVSTMIGVGPQTLLGLKLADHLRLSKPVHERRPVMGL